MAGLTLGAGCLDDGSEEPVSSVTSNEYSTVAVERVVPIHYYVLDYFFNSCPSATTDAAIYAGIQTANRGWQQAGIQFSVAKIDRLNGTPTLMNLDPTVRSYASVYPELRQIDPTLTPTTFNDSDTSDNWLFRIADRLPVTEIPLIVPCTELPASANGHATFPWMEHPHGLHIPPGMIANSTVSHELGHYFSLIHTFEVGTDNNDYDQLFGYDGRSPTFFRSATEVAAYRATGNPVVRKNGFYGDLGFIPGDQPNCDYVDTSTCEMKCDFGNKTYRTSTDPGPLSGISHAVTGASKAYATNVMSYWFCTGSDNVELKDLEPSQIEKVRTALRSPAGQRDQLGRSSVHLGPKRSSTTDFDGDGKRDVAFFRPETSTCVVRYSSDSREHAITIWGGDMTKGDIPVAADYDGDGKTDCAIYRPGTATTPAHWLWASSSLGFAVHDEQFGEGGDIPIPDVRLPAQLGNAGYGRYAVFRPTTGQVWWRDSATSVRWVAFGATAGDEIMPADYDRDGWTDLAFWQPKLGTGTSQARFKIAYSRNNFASRAFDFGLQGDVPLGPVTRDGDGQLDFAVWRPSNGVWYYLLNPRYDGTSGYYAVNWGIPGDVPVPGFDFDRDGLDDEVIWRPAGTGPTLFVRKGTTGGYFARAIGLPGDVPVLAPDLNYDGMPELFLYRVAGTPLGRMFEADSGFGTYPYAATIATSMRYTDILL